jgi:hypothetical protein
MKFPLVHFRRNRKAVSPAFSTMILTAGVIVLILVAMGYASNIMNLKLAQNEFSSNKQLMQTAGEQLDDIAWTIGRTQTVNFAGRFGSLNFTDQVVNYKVDVHTSSGWENLTFQGDTGAVLFNMPVSAYSMGDDYFERVPFTANSSFLLSGSSSPVSQVFCIEKFGMTDGGYLRVALVPTIRILNSTIMNKDTYKFYLPTLHSGDNPYRSQSLTMTGEGIIKITKPDVDQVVITATYPKAADGFDASFFNFKDTTITLNSTSTPKLQSGSNVEFYVGSVQVSIGAS